MSEPKTRPTGASVELFLAAQPAARQADCAVLLAMHERLSGEPALMWGPSIIGFGRCLYTLANGKRYEWPLAGFSPRKQALTLYVSTGFPAFDGLLARLGKHSMSKACLYIKKLADVDMGVLEQIIAGSLRASEANRVR
ncbi:MAG: DUF1801 domain-containing protein [Pseudomonadota bacterium]|nr:DUF1801 domain-containing protein [Pseudomonadota bacterium]